MKEPIEPATQEEYNQADFDYIEREINNAMCPQFARYLGKIVLYQRELLEDIVDTDIYDLITKITERQHNGARAMEDAIYQELNPMVDRQTAHNALRKAVGLD